MTFWRSVFYIGVLISFTNSAHAELPVAFKQCKSCHKLSAQEGRAIGPHLEGLAGAVIGQRAEGYKYSKALSQMGSDGKTWNAEMLSAFLENPKEYVRGTKMNFRGIKDDEKRQALVDFLLTKDATDQVDAAQNEMEVEVVLSAEILAISGDLEYGEYLSSSCVTCHSLDGSDEGIPAIVGWPDLDFRTAMYAYKEKIRPHPVMQMMAAPLADDEIAALAAYFGALE